MDIRKSRSAECLDGAKCFSTGSMAMAISMTTSVSVTANLSRISTLSPNRLPTPLLLTLRGQNLRVVCTCIYNRIMRCQKLNVKPCTAVLLAVITRV